MATAGYEIGQPFPLRGVGSGSYGVCYSLPDSRRLALEANLWLLVQRKLVGFARVNLGRQRRGYVVKFKADVSLFQPENFISDLVQEVFCEPILCLFLRLAT